MLYEKERDQIKHVSGQPPKGFCQPYARGTADLHDQQRACQLSRASEHAYSRSRPIRSTVKSLSSLKSRLRAILSVSVVATMLLYPSTFRIPRLVTLENICSWAFALHTVTDLSCQLHRVALRNAPVQTTAAENLNLNEARQSAKNVPTLLGLEKGDFNFAIGMSDTTTAGGVDDVSHHMPIDAAKPLIPSRCNDQHLGKQSNIRAEVSPRLGADPVFVNLLHLTACCISFQAAILFLDLHPHAQLHHFDHQNHSSSSWPFRVRLLPRLGRIRAGEDETKGKGTRPFVKSVLVIV